MITYLAPAQGRCPTVCSAEQRTILMALSEEQFWVKHWNCNNYSILFRILIPLARN